MARGAWEQARASFLAALERQESSEALEGLGKAAWWLNDEVTAFAAREQAYRLYRQEGDRLSAARMALHLGSDECSLHDAYALGSGWLQRAGRLLEGLDPAPEHGWVALWNGQIAMAFGHDSASACHSAAAVDLARSLRLLPLEQLAMAQRGLALAREGGVAPPVHLNRHMHAAVGIDLDCLDLLVSTCSQLMRGWDQLRDFGAIEEWWALLDGIPQRGPRPCVFWICRIEHAAALLWRGAWDLAEEELDASVEALVAIRREIAADGMARLAKVRRRRGCYKEAAALLERAEAEPLRVLTETLILLGWAHLALDEGDPETARSLAEQALTSVQGANPSERLGGLELLVHAEVARGNQDRARQALAELQHGTGSAATDGVRASTRFAEGMVAFGAGVAETARFRFEEAVSLFERASAHFETAQARIELAVTLSHLGDHEAARREAAIAAKALSDVGAAHEADRAHARLPREDTKAERLAGSRAPRPSFTSREVEILRLVAQGQSNHAIAAQLIVSVRTVESHLSNIYDKVGAEGKVARTAAVAYGLRHGLVST
ncbi:MAG: LuxR C-terminal-related transcriptional regulator [Chloroflexota bacterium]|nr:LuxR C-terminal-related transcriptional regulator [Chloroflexota bacterium]